MNHVIDMNNDNDDNPYGDSDFLASQDLSVGDFRQSDHENKRKIIEKMLALRHNMKYNKHLLSVYMKAKGLFDTMVEEHRTQLYYLDEIYRHINQLIRENLSRTSKQPNGMMSELRKDKKRIGVLLKRMRASYEKLMNVDTVVGVTIDKINEISFMDDAEMADNNKADNDDDDDEGDDEGDDEDEEFEASAENEDDDDLEDDEDDDDDEDDEDDLEDEEDEDDEDDLEDDDEDDEDDFEASAENEDLDDEDDEFEASAENEDLEDDEDDFEASAENDDHDDDENEEEDEEEVILLYQLACILVLEEMNTFAMNVRIYVA